MIPFQTLSWKHLIKPMPLSVHTYPLSACADERSFSSMKRIKTSLRNTMTDERLSSLAILHIHNFDKDANVDNVAKFAHQKARRQKMVWWRDDRKPCFFFSLCTQGFFFFFDVLLFHVHSTVPFFSKLVIPVHVSMEEPVLKTKEEKSTSVNVVVDGEETIAKKRRLQVPSKFRNVLHYTFVACKKYRDSTGLTLRYSVRYIIHERWILLFLGVIYKDRIPKPKIRVNHLTRCAT